MPRHAGLMSAPGPSGTPWTRRSSYPKCCPTPTHVPTELHPQVSPGISESPGAVHRLGGKYSEASMTSLPTHTHHLGQSLPTTCT